MSNHSCCIDSNVLSNHDLVGENSHGKGGQLIIGGVTELPNRSISSNILMQVSQCLFTFSLMSS